MRPYRVKDIGGRFAGGGESLCPACCGTLDLGADAASFEGDGKQLGRCRRFVAHVVKQCNRNGRGYLRFIMLCGIETHVRSNLLNTPTDRFSRTLNTETYCTCVYWR